MKQAQYWSGSDYELARQGLLMLLTHEEKRFHDVVEDKSIRIQIPTLLPSIDERLRQIKHLLGTDY